nr:unnamed protein product [Digitaria exilis]
MLLLPARGSPTTTSAGVTTALHRVHAPTIACASTRGSKGAPRKPQFISVLTPESLERMLIPAMFVQHYIPKEHLNTCMTAILRPLGKIGQFELKMDRSDLFITGGWSQFLTSHGITEANALLLRRGRAATI